MIAKLDDADGDPDLEATGDDEPSLASLGTMQLQRCDDDREEECEDEGIRDDFEPSLSWPEPMDQWRATSPFQEYRSTIAFVAGHGDQELEEQCEDEGADESDDDVEREHSLGWAESESRTGRLGGSSDDHEVEQEGGDPNSVDGQ